jgi:hypothetical protein
VDSTVANQPDVALAALLFQSAFKPVFEQLDPLGGYGASLFAQLLAEHLE